MKYLFVMVLLIPPAIWAEKKSDHYCQGHTENFLLQYAISVWGPVKNCTGRSYKNDSRDFGVSNYTFRNSVQLKIDFSPPESYTYDLESPKGFPNERNALQALREGLAKIDFKIDWIKSDLKKTKDQEVKTYWEPESSTNSRAVIKYRKNKLTAIGYGMAL